MVRLQGCLRMHYTHRLYMKDGCSQIPIFSMLDAAVLHTSLDSLLDKNSLIASLVGEHISDITKPHACKMIQKAPTAQTQSTDLVR